jgi:hypothetical protein
VRIKSNSSLWQRHVAQQGQETLTTLPQADTAVVTHEQMLHQTHIAGSFAITFKYRSTTLLHTTSQAIIVQHTATYKHTQTPRTTLYYGLEVSNTGPCTTVVHTMGQVVVIVALSPSSSLDDDTYHDHRVKTSTITTCVETSAKRTSPPN